MSCSIFRLLFIEPLNRALPLPLSALPLSLRVLIPLAWSGNTAVFYQFLKESSSVKQYGTVELYRTQSGRKNVAFEHCGWQVLFMLFFFFFPRCSKLDAITGGCFQSFCSCLFIWSRGYVCKAFLISLRPWNNAVAFQCWWRRVLKMFL